VFSKNYKEDIMIFKMMKFAEEKHKDQIRKATGDPYITHPIAVSYLVATYKRSKKIKELIVACHGHDLLEDTDTTVEELVREFGIFVASLIYELTNDEEEIKRLGKNEYFKIKLCGISSYGLIIKLCDRLHNVSDHPKPQYVSDTIELIKHLKSNRKLSGSQRDVCDEILRVCEAAQLEQFLEDRKRSQ